MNNNLANKIGIIVLNYRNYELTKKCVDNLIEIDVRYPIIIVDNNSPNESYKSLSEYYKEIHNVDVIKSKENKGYADGNNFGAKYLLDKYDEIKYICIMNPDVIVPYKELFINLANKISNRNDIAAISPMMIVKGKLDSKKMCWSFPNYKSLVLDHLMFRKKYNTAPMKGIYPDKNGIAIVDVIPGSFFMIKTECLLKINFLDTGTFLYNEENILALTLKKLNFKEALSINDFYYHNHLPSIKSQSLKEKFNSNRIVYESTKYLQEKYYNNKIVGLALSTCNYINKIYILCGYIPGNIKRKLAQKRKNK